MKIVCVGGDPLVPIFAIAMKRIGSTRDAIESEAAQAICIQRISAAPIRITSTNVGPISWVNDVD
jgi:hypothetical protein